MKKWQLQQIKEVGLSDFDDPANFQSVKIDLGQVVSYKKIRYFEPHEQGLKINYFNHYENLTLWDSKNKQMPFYRLRLKEVKEKQKYWQPYKSGSYIFCTPAVLSTKNIKHLLICEGEKKAFKLSMQGVCAVGIGGKDNFSDKSTKLILNELQGLIKDKDVKELTLLLDSDVYELGHSDDLFTRPLSFCNTVIRFNNLCKPLNCNVHFSHVEESFIKENLNGIDDIINKYKKENNDVAVTKIIAEIKLLSAGNQRDRNFVKSYNVSNLSDFNIKRLFSVESIHSFFKFYNLEFNVEYKLNRNIYKFYEEADGKIKHKMLSWGDANRYLSVGAKYKKITYDIDSNLRFEHATKESIKNDCNTQSNAIFEHIQKVDGFVYLPDNTENFKQIVNSYNLEGDINTLSRWFNTYQKLNYNYKDACGKFPNIEYMFKHIFSQTNIDGDSLYNFALDYLTLLFFEPTLRLPAICLVSTERATGKTTFIDFMQMLFKGNAVKSDNTRFSEKWTSSYANKLIILIDETMQNEEQKAKKEMLKNLITSNSIWIESKGVDATNDRFYGKFIFASNDELSFMQIDNVENRFCVIKVPVLPKPEDKENYTILQEMSKEIEPFLAFLYQRMQKHKKELERATFYPQKTRLYFDYKIYETKALKTVQDNSSDTYIRNVEELVKDMLYTSGKLTLFMQPKEIQDLYPLLKISPAKIGEALTKMKCERQSHRWYEFITRYSEVEGLLSKEIRCMYAKKRGNPFKIDAETIFSKKEFEDFKKDLCENISDSEEANELIDHFNSDVLPF